MIEGTLSKWTNVVQGWQYRYFVLDNGAGILSYYTSRERRERGDRRGCVRLRGAVCGIDDEDATTFTITVDRKTFHLQGRDADERDRWVRALEAVIHQHSGYYRPHSARLSREITSSRTECLVEFDRRIKEADIYLHLMTTHLQTISDENAHGVVNLQSMISSANAMIDTIKQAIVTMQMAKAAIVPNTDTPIDAKQLAAYTETITERVPTVRTTSLTEQRHADRFKLVEPPTSYSSDEEDFVDAREYVVQSDQEDSGAIVGKIRVNRTSTGESALPTIVQQALTLDELRKDQCVASGGSTDDEDDDQTRAHCEGLEPEPNFHDDHVDFDKLYADEHESELGNVQAEHGSVIMHLLSQVSIGMDLTKIPLPTFILERRSLLEMYADFFCHPDLFVNITAHATPEERMIAMVRWYLSCFHGGRRSTVAKKPYNPIIGETFRCNWQVPGASNGTSNHYAKQGPFPTATDSELTFIAEQVSHHPPVSAFYAEHPQSQSQCMGHIWTKSKFLGLSIGVHMVGEGRVSLLQHNEHYTASFPSGYGRSILTTPWVELGGKTYIRCEESGYSAKVEFHTKPFYGGAPHRITAEVFRPTDSKPFIIVKGEWNGEMRARYCDTGRESIFLDVRKIPICPKQCRPVQQQQDMESRRLWRHVTAALYENDIGKASAGKHWLEQRQRLQAKQRATRNEQWRTKFFEEAGEAWVYKAPLELRMRKK